MTDISIILENQTKTKARELSGWKNVRWEGGRLYYESQKILNEIKSYNNNTKLLYFQKLLEKDFTIHDNWPHETPDITTEFKNWIKTHISKLQLKLIEDNNKLNNFNIDNISFDKIGLNDKMSNNLISRINEAKKCYNAKAPLSIIFMSGSILEGILIGLAQKYPEKFNTCIAAPKSDGKVKNFEDWKLYEFIEVANKLELIKNDVKEFSHTLRNYRNFIHPNEQIKSKFNPNIDTAELCWKVLQLAIKQITENYNSLDK